MWSKVDPWEGNILESQSNVEWGIHRRRRRRACVHS